MGSLPFKTLPNGLKACSLPLMLGPTVLAPTGFPLHSLPWQPALHQYLTGPCMSSFPLPSPLFGETKKKVTDVR